MYERRHVVMVFFWLSFLFVYGYQKRGEHSEAWMMMMIGWKVGIYTMGDLE